jgi:uncharacterized membrane protein
LVAVPSGQPFFRRFLCGSGFAVTALLAGVAWRVPPDGQEHRALAQFLGRFHPLLVHLPIALLLVVPLLELAGILGRRPDLRPAAGFILSLAAASAVAAAADGWLLAWSGAYSGPLVLRHMWCGIGLAALSLAAAAVRPRAAGGAGPRGALGRLYGPLLAAAVGLMVWTSHQGGGVTHGETYLTDTMPARLRTWLGLAPRSRPVMPATLKPTATLYEARIQPIFLHSCTECHDAHKVKGGLRLDSYARLMQGGDGGPEIVPWHPADSELVRRLTLPHDDDDFMPNNHKNLLAPEEVHLIEQWIAAGASAAQPLRADPPPPAVAQ